MQEINYEKIQDSIIRPSRLCNHCGQCIPILDAEPIKHEKLSPHAIRGPISIWDEYPENCGYNGWLFWEREKQKHIIRKAKEELYALSFFKEDTIVAKNTTAKQRITELSQQISFWDKHGAKNW